MSMEAFEEFIDMPEIDEHKHYELIGNILCDMIPPSLEHSDLSYNITELFKIQLGKTGPCRVYQEQRVSIPDRPSVEPDVVLTCNIADRDKNQRGKRHRIQSPLIVVEILSPSTEDFDRHEKFDRYKLCPSLEVYILVSQEKRHVEVYRKSNEWKKEIFTDNQTFTTDQLDLEFPLDDIYEGVFENE